MLKVFCLDWATLHYLSTRPECQLPSTLEVIYFSCYYFEHYDPLGDDIDIEEFLIQVLTSRKMPRLQTVAVPSWVFLLLWEVLFPWANFFLIFLVLSGCWNYMYEDATAPSTRELWIKNRKVLQELEIFRNWVKLQFLGPREVRE